MGGKKQQQQQQTLPKKQNQPNEQNHQSKQKQKRQRSSNRKNNNQIRYTLVILLCGLVSLGTLFFTGPNNYLDPLLFDGTMTFQQQQHKQQQQQLSLPQTTVPPPQPAPLLSSSSSLVIPQKVSLAQLEYDYDTLIEHDLRCRSVLDALDDSFNRRRSMRQAYERQRQQTAGRQPVTEKTLYDIYEPDSVCLTDERFGNVRYQAYGDGPKFVCGVDMIAKKKKTTTKTTTTTTKSNTNQPKRHRLLQGFSDDPNNNLFPTVPQQQQQQSSPVTGSAIASTDNNDNNNNKDDDGCLVYSIGSNNQIDFEKSVHDFLPNCEIHTFDPTLKAPFIGGMYSTFHPWGLGKDSTTSEVMGVAFETYSLQTIQEKLGHSGRTIDILKIDCDLCEFDVMPPVFDDIIVAGKQKLQIDQIQIEVHSFDTLTPIHIKHARTKKLFDAADKANMRLFHKERNQWGCKAYMCVEFAWASEEFLRRANAQILCGTGGAGVV